MINRLIFDWIKWKFIFLWIFLFCSRQHLESPRVLSCLHVFCEKCLTNILNSDPNDATKINTIVCPDCKQSTTVSRITFFSSLSFTLLAYWHPLTYSVVFDDFFCKKFRLAIPSIQIIWSVFSNNIFKKKKHFKLANEHNKRIFFRFGQMREGFESFVVYLLSCQAAVNKIQILSLNFSWNSI